MDRSPGNPVLIIFDVDGTLVDAADLDNASFDLGFLEVTGARLPAAVWSEFEEITARAIVQRASSSSEIERVQRQVRDAFLARLQAGSQLNEAAIRPFPGAVELFDFFKSHLGYRVAIATGCWEETARFKLASAGFDLEEIPFASSSDSEKRSSIITLAAQRAGVPLGSSIYVGDGVWDLRAANQLGIPFVGVGRDREKLSRAGARHLRHDFSVAGFLDVLRKADEERSVIMT